MSTLTDSQKPAHPPLDTLYPLKCPGQISAFQAFYDSIKIQVLAPCSA